MQPGCNIDTPPQVVLAAETAARRPRQGDKEKGSVGLTFEALSEANAAEWDNLVRASPDGWTFSLAGWQRLILAVGEWGLEDHSFAIREGARMVAVMPLQYRAATATMGSSGWGGSGPVVAAERTGPAREHLFTAAIEEGARRAAAAGAERLEMWCSPVTRSSLCSRWGVNPFALRGLQDTSLISQVIDLSGGPEALWAGLSKTARQAVRRAEDAGYEVKKVDWAASLDTYYDIHCETYARDGLPPHPKRYFAGIAAELGPSGAATLWAALDPRGEAVAFHNDSRLGPAAYYHTGCSRTAVRNAGVSYMLAWRAILNACENGLAWYDVGWIFPAAQNPKQQGLTLFKTRFGGEPHRAFAADLDLARAAKPSPPRALPSSSRAVYEADDLYKVDTICNRVKRNSPEYVDRLLDAKIELVRKHARPGLLVDLCCATGEHLFELAADDGDAIGLDFSVPFIARARAVAAARGSGISFAVADAKRLPLPDASASTLYSFSALYAIEGVADVIREVGRVLAIGGRCVLDLGNSHSLNAICVKAYTELPQMHFIAPAKMRALVEASGMRVVAHSAFQILPLWAGKPKWLSPLLHPYWKTILSRRVQGRMLDEWLSNFPLLKPFAFRHILVCEKI